MVDRFPRDVTDAIGQFQLVEVDETPVGQIQTGTLRLEGRTADLEVSPELTPSVQWEQQEDGSLVGHSSDTEPTDFTVIGLLSRSPSEVSLWRTNTVGRRRLGFSFPGKDSPGNHEMRADWCITGAHLADPSTTFSTVFFDIANLHEWSGLSYTTETASLRTKTGLPHTWTLDFPKTDPLPLDEGIGTLKFSPRADGATRSVRGFHVSTNTFIKIDLQNGLNLDDLVTQYGQPLAVLMTLLAGAECSIREIELHDEDSNVLNAYGKIVDREAPTSPGQLFLSQQDTSVNLMNSWLSTATNLSPVPEILASLWSDSIPYLETRALTLSTTAEALHRLLHPNARRFTTEEIEQSIASLANSTMPTSVRESIDNALNNYWAEKSYPQRIAELAEPVADAVPTCVGKINRWKQAITNLRVQLAHGLNEESLDSEEILKINALSTSMLWVLTFRLLLHSGVTPSELGIAAERNERYQLDVRRWNKHWPKIFTSE